MEHENLEQKPKFYYSNPKTSSFLKKFKNTSWDRHIPFEQLARRFTEDFTELLSLWHKKRKRKILSKQIVYYAIAMIQLLNGLRASEAVELFRNWILNPELVEGAETHIRKRRDSLKADFIIPNLLTFNRNYIEKAVEIGFGLDLANITVNGYKKWMISNLNINTHTLRKAWESYASRTWQKDVSYIASYQGRKNLNSHLYYLRREEFKPFVKEIDEKYFRPY